MSEFEKYEVQRRDTLGDIAVRQYGRYEGVSLLIRDNRDTLTAGFDTALDVGMVLKIRIGESLGDQDAFELITENENRAAPDFTEITVQSRQTLGDIAVQEYGGYEGIAFLLADNQEALADKLTTTLYQGLILKIRMNEAVDDRVLPKLKAQGIEPATGLAKGSEPVTGPDYNDDYNDDYTI
jgi:hypothetical protein